MTNTSDDGTGSLRAAIEDSNSVSGPDVIEFNLTGSLTINLQSGLPIIDDPVEIDGWSQSGFNGAPLITLDGGLADNSSSGLRIRASGTTVRGLVINDFGQYGILVEAVSDVRIQGNYIGTDDSGSSADGNDLTGIYFDEVTNSIIGAEIGSQQPEQERNVISGNLGDGVIVRGGSNNTIAGNYIGVGADGVTAIPNAFDGIEIRNGINASTGNMIGGSSAGERNIISGNSDDAIVIWSSTNNTISGNYIGLAADGMTEVANLGYGVLIGTGAEGVRADNNLIGGQSSSEGNVIAGNGDDGIILWGVSGTEVTSNYVGVAADGATVRANGDGITVNVNSDGVGSDSNVIGGTNLQNVIGGSEGYGIFLNGAGVTSTEIVENFIGVADDGTTDIGNALDGILVWGAMGTTIRGNQISGNESDGISVGNASDATIIQSNYIGTDRFATATVPNAQRGILILGASTNTLVGGTAAGAGNVVSGNLSHGIWIGNSGTENNVVEGNLIGTTVNGDIALPNSGTGIVLSDGAKNNPIGGAATGAGNVVSGNLGHGIWIGDPGTENNVVEGNLIGTTVNGDISLSNNGTGIVLSDGAKNNPIGGAATGAGNVVSGNLGHGIWAGGFESEGNTIQGNLVGTDLNGLNAIGNSYDGVVFFQAGHHQIGGTNAGEGNVIASNGSDGIAIVRGAQGQVVQGNLIGVGLDGVTSLGNGGEGIQIVGGDLQGNPPTIIYIIDRSGSTDDTFEGTPVGDVNDDGAPDTVLDAELAGFIEFTERLDSLGFGNVVEVGVTIFDGSADALDMDPVATGVQLSTLVGANLDGGELDIVEALRRVQTRGGNTDFADGLQSAYDTFDSLETGEGDGNIIFVSDGDNRGGSFETQLALLDGLDVNRIAVGMGEGSELDELELIDADAQKVFSSDEFTDSLLAVLGLNPNQSGSSSPAGTNVLIGGTVAGAGNVIANNGADGIDVQNFLATGNSILGNSIYNNGHLGIELQGNGVEINDILDEDAGANDLTNYPVLNDASLQSGMFSFEGTLSAEPNQSYRVELFGSQQANSFGFVEGEQFLGFINLTTDGSGDASFDDTFNVQSMNFSFVTATATVDEMNGNTSEFSASIDVDVDVEAVVLGRSVFYNDSSFDSGSQTDVDAIAVDKMPLFNGQVATFSNYSSSIQGINGLVISIDGFSEAPSLSGIADFFEFRVGNNNDPDNWLQAPTPTGLNFEENVDASGLDRVTLTWPNNAIEKTWLQVKVLASNETGLSAEDTFYFGNAPGETGNDPANATVNLVDVALSRVNQTGFGSAADIGNLYDFNRDGRVNLVDVALARTNQSGFAALRLIDLTGVEASGSRAASPESKAVDFVFESKQFFGIARHVETNFELTKIDDAFDKERFLRTVSAVAMTEKSKLSGHQLAVEEQFSADEFYAAEGESKSLPKAEQNSNWETARQEVF